MVQSVDLSAYYSSSVELLKRLIAIPSTSRWEDKTAGLLEDFLKEKKFLPRRAGNNVWAIRPDYDSSLPTVMLNSHHDTVPPNTSYTFDPYKPFVQDGKLFGLGSNDAGGPLVSLLFTFLFFSDHELPFNLIFAASAEEEVSGKSGVEMMLHHLPEIDMAIVGEPTQMKMAIAEKGLLVLDCTATGISGHAARNEGVNALYRAVDDITTIRKFSFEKISEFLGEVHLAVTSIETANKSHNVVPDECSFVIDVRVNEKYALEEIITILENKLKSDIRPRSVRLKPSFIPENHPLVKAGHICGFDAYGSPTLSDMALMNFPAVKIGPGHSARSHTANEYIYIKEIEQGISGYLDLINNLKETIKSKR